MDFAGTLFFNHLSGNSLLHFHFHYSIYDIKINSILEDILNKKYIKNKNDEYELFNLQYNVSCVLISLNACMHGIILISDDIKILVDYIYNILIKNKSNKNYINIALYSSKSRKYKIGLFPKKGITSLYGSSELSGYIITKTNLESTKDLETDINDDCSRTVMDIKYLHSLTDEYRK
jgi:hypothetical protein